MSYSRLFLLLSTLTMSGVPCMAHAKIETRCKGLSGRSYRFNPDSSGALGQWIDVKEERNEFLLKMPDDPSSSPDIIVIIGGKPYPFSESGFDISLIGKPENLLVTVINRSAGIMNTYLFRLDANGNGEVAMTSTASDKAVSEEIRSSLLIAKCSSP